MNLQRLESLVKDSDRGYFITIEGQDGAGKSSNIEAILNVLKKHDINFVTTREPGGTELGEVLRGVLLGSNSTYTGSISDMSELLLVFAARAQHLDQVIVPALEQGTWVVCDRFTDATFAYQGGGRDMGSETIERLQELVQGPLKPDMTVLLDVPVQVGEDRAGARSKPDRFELENIEFKQKVRDAYLKLANDEPNRVKLVNANNDLETVQGDVAQLTHQFIADRT